VSEWLTKRGDELVPGDSVGSCGPVESVKPTEDGEVEVTFAPESALGYAARRVGRDGDRVTIIFSSDQPVAVVELEPVLDLEMALAYVQVHSRKINAHVRSGLGYRKIPHPSGNFALELEKALQEARGCVAALERMIPGD